MSNGTVTWSYSYNADGLRIKRTNGTVTYSYVYLGGELEKLTVGTEKLAFAYDAEGTPLTVRWNGTYYFYLTNLQGDVIAITDETGTIVVQYTYDAWGNPLTTTGTLATTLGQYNPLRYRSYVYDQETGLYYLQSRYYNPEIGRFINADGLIATGQGLLGNNMFAYCLNNSIMRIDQTGCGSLLILPAAWEVLDEWIHGDGEEQQYTEGSSIVRKIRRSILMKGLVNLAISNYITKGETITSGSEEFTADIDGWDLYLAIQHFDYTMYVTAQYQTTGMLWWEHTEVRHHVCVVITDTYNFDEFRSWNGFGNIMNNLACIYDIIVGGHDFDFISTYTYTTQWYPVN